MTPQFARAIDPVIEYVLELLDRLESGQEACSADRERDRILHVLNKAEANLGAGNKDWRAAKFALVSWIDEMLCSSIWAEERNWAEKPLEHELFGTADRALEYYLWAKKAAAERQRDSLEVYYLCVILGFRGLYDIPNVAPDLIDRYELPATLPEWVAHIGSAIQLRRGIPPVTPTGSSPRGAPELKGYSLWMGALLALMVAAAVAGLTAIWAL